MSRKEEDNFSNRFNLKWVVGITLWTFVLSIVFSIIAGNIVQNLGIITSFLTLIIIIFIGIIFDIIGIAVTSAEEKPFHAMAANKINEAKIAILLIRNAGQVSNFCNDVIGDISGIISGAIGATLIYKLVNTYGFKDATLLSILLTGLTASFTVGGKAIGKAIALYNCDKIIFQIAKIYDLFERLLGINFLNNKKKNSKKD